MVGVLLIALELVHAAESCSGPMSYVLLVEDEAVISLALSEALEEAGFHVHAESEGRRALDVAKMLSFAAVIIDLGLPDMSGREVAVKLRRRYPQLPIFVCSGYDVAEISKWAAEMNIAAMEKPVDEQRLIAAIRQTSNERPQTPRSAPHRSSGQRAG